MGNRVLIVEDEPLIAMLIEDLLPELGFHVQHTAGSVDAALKAIELRDIDLALLDVNLSGTPSFPVAEALSTLQVPFVFTTGYGQLGIPEQFAHCPVLAKPFRIAELQAALQACSHAG